MNCFYLSYFHKNIKHIWIKVHTEEKKYISAEFNMPSDIENRFKQIKGTELSAILFKGN